MRTINMSRVAGPVNSYTPNAATTVGMLGHQAITLSIQTHPIRIRFDGTAAAAGVGLLLPVGVYTFDVDSDAVVSIIDTAAGASAVDVQLWR